MSSTGVYLISGFAVPPKNHGDYGYFGLSIDIDRRFEQHETALKRGKHGNNYLQNRFNLYGGSNHFIWEIAETCEQDELKEKEIFHIEKGNTFKNPKGFNLTPGGEGDAKYAAAKTFAFKDVENGTLFCGTNLAEFCREHPHFNYQQLSRLRRGEIDIYENLIALETPEINPSDNLLGD